METRYKTAFENANELREKYKLLGDDFEILNHNKLPNTPNDLYVKVKYVPDDFFIKNVAELSGHLEIVHGGSYYINAYYDIYTDILYKRRIKKIINLKEMINAQNRTI
jgi:hypothetical protein